MCLIVWIVISKGGANKMPFDTKDNTTWLGWISLFFSPNIKGTYLQGKGKYSFWTGSDAEILPFNIARRFHCCHSCPEKHTKFSSERVYLACYISCWHRKCGKRFRKLIHWDGLRSWVLYELVPGNRVTFYVRVMNTQKNKHDTHPRHRINKRRDTWGKLFWRASCSSWYMEFAVILEEALLHWDCVFAYVGI